jgi:SAM-dependent methyltransferase
MTHDDPTREALSEDARMRFEALYERQGSWDVERPQPSFVALAQQGWIRGDVLDVGCGTGDNALHMAALGYPTWGIDIVPGAIASARSKAMARGLAYSRFLVADVLALESLGMQFDTVIDSGLFHALSNRERPFFLAGLRMSVRVGGHYHMLGFRDEQPGQTGPRRLAAEDLRSTFCEGWRVLELRDVRFETNIHPGGALAWLMTVARVD